MEAALKSAVQPPIAIMEACAQALPIIALCAEKGSIVAVSDAGVAASLCRAALESASLNVFINTQGMLDQAYAASLNARVIGELDFIFAVAPHHPLAKAEGPISDAMLLAHRLIVVADSGVRDKTSYGLMDGQDILTVDSMATKLQAQVRGLGCGFLPRGMAQVYIDAGLLVTRQVQRAARSLNVCYAWPSQPHHASGRALQWWLQQLESPATRQALMENYHRI